MVALTQAIDRAPPHQLHGVRAMHLVTFTPALAPSLASFLNHIRREHWALSSMAYMAQPNPLPSVSSDELILAHQRQDRVGTFLLTNEGEIISMLQVDDKHSDGSVAVFSGVETLPRFQRRGTFWRHLGDPCIRRVIDMGFVRLEAVTWVFNRKGIPLFKKAGFRAVPGTSLVLENYLPLALRHSECQRFFGQHDFLRTLQCKRSYGYDSIRAGELDVFSYTWQAADERLSVQIDWRRKRVASVQID